MRQHDWICILEKSCDPAFTRSPKTVGWQAGGAEGVVKMLGGLENLDSEEETKKL